MLCPPSSQFLTLHNKTDTQQMNNQKSKSDCIPQLPSRKSTFSKFKSKQAIERERLNEIQLQNELLEFAELKRQVESWSSSSELNE